MRAHIDALGVLHVVPDTETEGYALQCWIRDAEVPLADTVRAEHYHYRGSKLKLEPPELK